MSSTYFLGMFSFHKQVDKEVNPTEVAEQRTVKFMIDEIGSHNSEAAKAQLRTRYGIKDDSNPMLKLPADLFR